MSNMSYCRFQNTVSDLQDCQEALAEGKRLSKEEEDAAVRLITTCIEIAQAYLDHEDPYTKEQIRKALRFNYRGKEEDA